LYVFCYLKKTYSGGILLLTTNELFIFTGKRWCCNSTFNDVLLTILEASFTELLDIFSLHKINIS